MMVAARRAGLNPTGLLAAGASRWHEGSDWSGIDNSWRRTARSRHMQRFDLTST
jgi:hypothetical protein